MVPLRRVLITFLAVLATAAPAAAADPTFARDDILRIDGAAGDRAGNSVTSVGDLNGDGLGDVVVGATRLRSFVVYGTAATTPLSLERLTAAQGFLIRGVLPRIAGVGDVDHDGYGDLAIGNPVADPRERRAAGSTYVVYGAPTQAALDLRKPFPDGRGFQIDGARRYEQSGRSINGAGDVNGDGYSDVIIGAPAAGGYVLINSGAAYVVYGAAASTDLDLRDLTPRRGYRLAGEDRGDAFGASVSTAGDFNGDGLSDVIVGAPGAENGTTAYAGSSFVFLGETEHEDFPLSRLTPDRGFRFDGRGCYQRSGTSVGWMGDINGDGLDDVLVGAPDWCRPQPFGGAAYVLYGDRGRGSLDFAGLRRSYGYRTQAGIRDARFGNVVSGAGDLDGDGFNDFLVRAAGIGAGGIVYVVHGAKRSGPPLREILNAGRSGMVSGAGDFNGDGRADLIIGSPYGGSQRAGAVYIVSATSDVETSRSSTHTGGPA